MIVLTAIEHSENTHLNPTNYKKAIMKKQYIIASMIVALESC
jgi:hypothetical protein